MTNPVDLIVRAICTQENSLNTSRNNPGNLRYEKQLNASAPGWNGIGEPPIAHFTTKEAGLVALYRQVWLYVAEGLTLRKLIDRYSTTDKAAYMHNVLTWTGLLADVPIIYLIPDPLFFNVPRIA